MLNAIRKLNNRKNTFNSIIKCLLSAVTALTVLYPTLNDRKQFHNTWSFVAPSIWAIFTSFFPSLCWRSLFFLNWFFFYVCHFFIIAFWPISIHVAFSTRIRWICFTVSFLTSSWKLQKQKIPSGRFSTLEFHRQKERELKSEYQIRVQAIRR